MKQTVFITGSSRGIGKACALFFAQQGWNVVINCKNSIEAMKEVQKEILAMGVSCLALQGDVGDYETVTGFYNQIQKHFGLLDVLINNAGISKIGLFQDMKPTEWNEMIQTNLSSVYNCSSMAIPLMLSNGHGKIINISSVWGVAGASCEVAYSTTKGGINAFTKALGKELAPSNIQVNAIACGCIDTEMNQFLDLEEREALIEEIPACRMGKAKEVAELAYSIATGHNYLTSQVIQLDGGWI
ncbi:elongation factor P 5-aminopentanone reductase [[Clostridium] polysaccharolyticum]|uniref:3-oxoacyl-[acyl-carrier protein] reductase n=1 Tax=[Clostridium] polysaccharolyticum TaxID=29364 RepID=A0A1I0G1I6_9FIRM|nr:SDR family NAD(P)-dependent oxidoreductase [[Clostridium] polysaccharolyticum]SET63708.1 3-oxoacyl-[acyl-carrier protein] reductase [[Clostridium] polysaccharolyticum]